MNADPFFLPPQSVVSFSGGRTSGYMLWRIMQAHGGALPEDRVVVFCNTGKECEETLAFVEECSRRWAVPIRWLEYRREADAHSFAAVNYSTASRNGEPLRAVIQARNFLPNPVMRFCTAETKIRTTNRFVRTHLNWPEYGNAIGLRADEPKRVAKMRAKRVVTVEKTLFEEIKHVERGASHPPGESPLLPLADAGVTNEDVLAFWRGQSFDLRLPVDERTGRTLGGNCDLCLAGETEVVTAEGIKTLRELAGTTPELLVPKVCDGVTSEVGHFAPAPVRSFGTQRLWKINLKGHGRAGKTVFATAEHRWFLTRPKKGQPVPTEAVPTSALRQGDKLRNLFRCQIGESRGAASRIGAMRGFVFGDGTVASGSRPGILHIHEGKDEVFLPMFEACCGPSKEGVSATGGKLNIFYGLPGYWKAEFPSLKESRRYLMGWLSGWFAADGCVDENGTCVLNSASESHLRFARSLCAVLGIQCSQVRHQDRDVKPPGGEELAGHRIFALNINRNHLTADFFWLAHHKARAGAAASKEVRRYGWTVESVEPTDRVEEVFCATVEGVGAFGLADGLMTGNCFLKGAGTIVDLIRQRPERADWWIESETLISHRDRPETARFRADRPPYAELRRIALGMADEPGWLQMDRGGMACGDVTECNCTD